MGINALLTNTGTVEEELKNPLCVFGFHQRRQAADFRYRILGRYQRRRHLADLLAAAEDRGRRTDGA